MTGSKRVVIAGGGVSGLAAAYDLKRAGIECVVFEKRPRLGGVIETRHWENCTFDNGPDGFLSQKPEALALIEELGLGAEVIGSNDSQRTTYILKQGRLLALPEGMTMMVPSKLLPVLRSPLLSWAAKFRMAPSCSDGRGLARTAAWRISCAITSARRRWTIWPSRCFPASTAAIRPA